MNGTQSFLFAAIKTTEDLGNLQYFQNGDDRRPREKERPKNAAQCHPPNPQLNVTQQQKFAG